MFHPLSKGDDTQATTYSKLAAAPHKVCLKGNDIGVRRSQLNLYTVETRLPEIRLTETRVNRNAVEEHCSQKTLWKKSSNKNIRFFFV
jgi:hypothetical protein